MAQLKSDFSRSFLQKFIKSRGVLINGTRIKKPDFTVRPHDSVEIPEHDLNVFKESFAAPYDPALNYESHNIIFEDKTFIVFNKPPGIRTEIFIGKLLPVHRLDKDTSGVLVAAKDPVTQAALQKQWQERKVAKTYIALVKGNISPIRGRIEAGISRSTRDRKKMAVSSSPRSRSASTEYKVINSTLHPLPSTLLYLFPETGRTHQIRVHLAAIGHPVIGDKLYGDPKINKEFEKLGLSRQFLHAAELILKHPKTRKKITFKAKMPEDLIMLSRAMSC